MAGKKEEVRVKVDALVKKQAEGILKQLEISPEKAIQLFYKQIILHKGLPFELKLPESSRLEDPSEDEVQESEEYEKGFRDFCSSKVVFEQSLETAWYADHVHMDCTGKVRLELRVEDEDLVRKYFGAELHKDPFVSADSVKRWFKDLFFAKIERDFDEYCEEDDYYPPVVEDYGDNLEALVENLCEEYGFKLMNFEYEGDTSDYIRN